MMFRPPRLMVVLWLTFLAVCGTIIAGTRFTADMSAFLPKQPSPEQQVLVEQLSDGVVSRMILIAIEGTDEAGRAMLSERLAEGLRQTGLFVQVQNGQQIANARDRELLFQYRYQLSPAVSAARFSSAGLHEAIGDSINLLTSPAGFMLKSLLTRDPTGEMVALFNTMNGSAQPDSRDGVWMSHDGARALLLVQTRAAGSDTDGQEAAVTAIRDSFDAVRRQAGAAAATARLAMTGPGVFSVSARHTIKGEVTRLSLISVSLIVLLLFTIYRSVTALTLGLLPVLSGAVAGIAAVSLGFGAVHGITIGFGTTLIGEAVDYSIYLFVQSRRDGSTDPAGWLTEFWPTIRLGVFTSLIGFSALLFSAFPGLSQLGLYSIAGLISAALVTRFVLPSLLPNGFQVRDVSRLGALLLPVLHHARPLRWSVGLLLLVAVAVIYSHRHTLWNSELSALSPIGSAEQALDARLRADLGAPDTRYLIVVSGGSVEAVLQASEKVGTQLQPLVASGAIAGFQSAARYLPSAATQRDRMSALPPRPVLAQRLQEATRTLPLRAARLEPFLDDVEQARRREPLRPADLEGTSLGLAVNALLLHHGGQWRALMPLQSVVVDGQAKGIDEAAVQQALRTAAQPGTLFVDMKRESDRLYSGYLREAIGLSLAGVAAIVALLLFQLRSLARVVRVVAPLAMAVLLITAALVLAGERLILLHLIGMLLIVAVGSNYALFFDSNAATAERLPSASTLASLLVANFTTVAGFGLLAFSSVPVLHAIGITVGPGAVLALLLSAIMSAQTGRATKAA